MTDEEFNSCLEKVKYGGYRFGWLANSNNFNFDYCFDYGKERWIVKIYSLSQKQNEIFLDMIKRYNIEFFL